MSALWQTFLWPAISCFLPCTYNFQDSGCQWLTDAGFVYTLKKPKLSKRNILLCDLSHSTSMLSVQSAWPVRYLCVPSPPSHALGVQVLVAFMRKTYMPLFMSSCGMVFIITRSARVSVVRERMNQTCSGWLYCSIKRGTDWFKGFYTSLTGLPINVEELHNIFWVIGKCSQLLIHKTASTSTVTVNVSMSSCLIKTWL